MLLKKDHHIRLEVEQFMMVIWKETCGKITPLINFREGEGIQIWPDGAKY